MPGGGLTSKEARARLLEHGPNLLIKKRHLSWLGHLLASLKNPLTLALLFIAALSFFLGERFNATIIWAVVGLSVGLDFYNNYKSEKAADLLQSQVKTTVQVLRDGKAGHIALEKVVPGDVVLLESGSIVPADGKILESNTLFVDESSMTGEAYPVPKKTGELLFMGSSVISGSGQLMIEKTGSETKFSHIASALDEQVITDFDRSMAEFSSLILKGVIGLATFVFVVNALLRGDIINSLLFAIVLAVGLTPELLPMIVTLNLTKGAKAMASHGVIVKKISAIQNFGSMDVLCTDKTGTLTENKISLVKCVDGLGGESKEVFRFAYLNCQFETGIQSALDQAVKDFDKLDISQYRKIAETPFDFERRCSSVTVRHGSKEILITKGAVEELLMRSRFYSDVHTHLTRNRKFKIHHTYEELSKEGFRVLGVAIKPHSSKEQSLIFLGFLAFLDPAKYSSEKTLKALDAHGIGIKILTGDNELVSQKIAHDIRLKVAGTLTGDAIALMSEKKLYQAVEENTIFARLTPDQKLRIIKALRAKGHVVGYMGDGVNDAPSLRQADVGISVQNAVDVAKETADIILLEPSLRQLVNGVIEGRKTFVNTSKYLMMSIASNFGNMISMAVASVVLPFLPMLPTQILLNNLIYDTSQLALPFDNVAETEIDQPKHWDLSGLKRFMLFFGPVSSLFDFLTFAVFLGVLHFAEPLFQTAWFLESITTQIFVVYVIRSKVSFLKDRPAAVLVLGSVLAGLFSWLIAQTALGHIFGFSALSLVNSLIIAGIVASYLLTVWIVKRIWFYQQPDSLAAKPLI